MDDWLEKYLEEHGEEWVDPPSSPTLFDWAAFFGAGVLAILCIYLLGGLFICCL